MVGCDESKSKESNNGGVLSFHFIMDLFKGVVQMTKPIEIKRYFEEKYLKHSCFDSLEELLEDKATIQVNAPRALIAVELMGAWRGLNDDYREKQTLEEVLKELKEIHVVWKPCQASIEIDRWLEQKKSEDKHDSQKRILRKESRAGKGVLGNKL